MMSFSYIRGLIAALFLALSLFSSPALAQGSPPPSDPGGGGFLGLNIGGGGERPNFETRRDQAYTKMSSAGCWPCKIFNSFQSGIFRSIDKADDGGRGLIPVLTGFATVFALFYLGSAFVSGDASDLLGRWQVFWRLCIAVAAASTVLNAGAASFMWDYVYSTLFSIGAAISDAFGVAAMASGGNCPSPSIGGLSGGAESAVQSMSATVCGGYQMTLRGIATGYAVATWQDGIINAFIYGFCGIALMAIYGLLALTFPLRFIDVLIRLSIVSLITPFLVVAAVFKPTRGYASIAIANVLNATALFAIVSIIFVIGSNVMDTFLEQMGLINGVESNNIIFGESDRVDVIVNVIVLTGVALTFLGMLRSAPAIAAEFSRSSGGSSSAGDAAVSAATAPVRMAAGGAGLAAGGVGAVKMRSAAAATRATENAAQAQAIGRSVGGAVETALGKNRF